MHPARARSAPARAIALGFATMAAAALLMGCGDDDEAGSDSDGGVDTVSQADAEQAALDDIGEGDVTWSGPEDDRGAAWEVEITRPDGSEVDVLVAADGSIVKRVERYLPSESGGATTATTAAGDDDGGDGDVTLDDAEQAALAAVGEGEVTWSGPEDDRGAAWEVEITRPDGSEVDVLVAADGTVID